MKTCMVCKKSAKYHPELSFHKFPSNEEKSQKWLTILQLNLKSCDIKSQTICSEHFGAENLCLTKTGIRLLKKNALPLRYNPSPICTISTVENIPSTSVKLEESILHTSTLIATESEELPKHFEAENLFLKNEFPLSHNPSPISTISTVENISSTLVKIEESVPQETNLNTSASPVTVSNIIIKLEETPTSATENICFSSTSTTQLQEAILHSSTITEVEMLKRKYKRRTRRDAIQYRKSDFLNRNIARKTAKAMEVTLLKQNKKIKLLNQTIRRLKVKVHSLETLIQDFKQKGMISNDDEDCLRDSLSSTAKIVLERFLSGSRNENYSPELRSFALTLNNIKYSSDFQQTIVTS